MKITNRLGLPEPLVRAVTPEARKRVPGRISLTTLTTPPQIHGLSFQHDEELVEDASDRIFALMGTLLHDKLESHAKTLHGEIAEEKLEYPVLGWTVSGKYDLSEMILEGELLTDYKLTSVYALKDGVKHEFVAQLNCYAHLIRHAGRNVSQLQIVAVGRDWSRRKALYDKDYPQQQVKVMSVELWTPEQTQAFMEERVRLHQDAEKGIWPECSPQDRWAKDPMFAVMKKGQKRAVKLYTTRHAAEWALAKDQYIQERPGESIRCEAYCRVSQYCEQRKRILAADAEAKTQNNQTQEKEIAK